MQKRTTKPATTVQPTGDPVGEYFATVPLDRQATAAYMQCQTCGDRGPVITDGGHLGAVGGTWHDEHHKTAGHSDFSHYTLTRTQARVFRF